MARLSLPMRFSTRSANALKDRVANAPPPGTSVVIVDDVVTTGRSTIEAIAAAKEIGCNVVGAIVLMDRLEDNGAANIQQEVPHYHAVFTRDDFPEIGEGECHTPKLERRSTLTASS
jgi:orotate phosphoribosyltransferase